MKPLLSVLTHPARRDYFAATMASVRAAGGDEYSRTVFIDGQGSLSPSDHDWYRAVAGPGWSFAATHPSGEAIGTKSSMLAVLHAAAGSERLIYLEDDIVLCKNAISFVARYEMPLDVAFVSFCDIKNAAPRPGLTVCPGYDYDAPMGQGGHWGNQMLLIPGRSLRFLRDAVALPDWGDARIASDIMLGISLATGPAPWRTYGIYSPSLAQHVGERSLVNPNAVARGFGRDTLTFPGTAFDAMTLAMDPPRQPVVPLHLADAKTRIQIRFRGGNGPRNRSQGDTC